MILEYISTKGQYPSSEDVHNRLFQLQCGRKKDLAELTALILSVLVDPELDPRTKEAWLYLTTLVTQYDGRLRFRSSDPMAPVIMLERMLDE